MPAKRRQSLPSPTDIRDLLDEMAPVPALSDSDLDPIEALVDAPADQFQKALSPAFRKLVVEGLRNIPAPKTLKDLTSLYSIFEKIEGLNKKDDKTIHIGLVTPLRNVTRKPVEIGAAPVVDPVAALEAPETLEDAQEALDAPEDGQESFEV